jgi:putative two-component system response regulator
MTQLTPETATAALARANIVGIIRTADVELAGASRRPDRKAITIVEWIASLIDAETGGHVGRVAMNACTLARACGWSATSVDHLAVAALLHDIGKIAVPPWLLAKRGPLTASERTVVERHTTFARVLLAGCRSPELRMARDVAAHHHERWDGDGYPHALAGARIPLAARIVALADVFDALTTDRPYRRALSFDTALGMIGEGAGTHFDPCLTAAFLNIHGEARRCA